MQKNITKLKNLEFGMFTPEKYSLFDKVALKE